MSRNASNNENDESDGFVNASNNKNDESDRFDKILPDVKIRANDLKGWVQQKWRIWRK